MAAERPDLRNGLPRHRSEHQRRQLAIKKQDTARRHRKAAPGVAAEELIKAQIWQAHSLGKSPAAIAAEVNARWADKGFASDEASITGWLARQLERRGLTAPTRIRRLSQLESGLEVLRGNLAMAYEEFSGGAEETGRAAALYALISVCEFVEGYADVPSGKLAASLRTLAIALNELDEGRVHPMLDKPKIGHRAPMGFAGDTLATFAVIALEAAVQDRTPLRQASEQVARELTRRGYSMLDGKPISAATVRNWRARASEGPGGSYDRAQRLLANIRIKVLAGDLPSQRGFTRILDALDEWAPLSGLRRKTRS